MNKIIQYVKNKWINTVNPDVNIPEMESAKSLKSPWLSPNSCKYFKKLNKNIYIKQQENPARSHYCDQPQQTKPAKEWTCGLNLHNAFSKTKHHKKIFEYMYIICIYNYLQIKHLLLRGIPKMHKNSLIGDKNPNTS
jgi:hypothetical protein